jgi:hypothetical protein
MVGGLAGGEEGEIAGKKAQKKRGPGKPDPLNHFRGVTKKAYIASC